MTESTFYVSSYHSVIQSIRCYATVCHVTRSNVKVKVMRPF